MPLSVSVPWTERSVSGAPEPLDSPQNRAMIRILHFLVDAGHPDTVVQRAAVSLRMLPEVAWTEVASDPDATRDLGVALSDERGGSVQYLNVHLVETGDLAGKARVRALLDLTVALHRRAWEVRHLADAAHTDALTGLSNRRGFEPLVDQALARWQRTGEAISLVLCDIDRFKAINDRLGHHAGDDALVTVSRALQAAIRPTDAAARLGGDEFGLLLAGSDAEGAHVVAQRLRNAVERTNPLTGQILTLSVGIADTVALRACGGGAALRQAFFRAADEALYMVKGSGRNGAMIHPGCAIPTLLECRDTQPILLT